MFLKQSDPTDFEYNNKKVSYIRAMLMTWDWRWHTEEPWTVLKLFRKKLEVERYILKLRSLSEKRWVRKNNGLKIKLYAHPL
jgi:hypothetical protein